jgi:hypothetical protein
MRISLSANFTKYFLNINKGQGPFGQIVLPQLIQAFISFHGFIELLNWNKYPQDFPWISHKTCCWRSETIWGWWFVDSYALSSLYGMLKLLVWEKQWRRSNLKSTQAKSYLNSKTLCGMQVGKQVMTEFTDEYGKTHVNWWRITQNGNHLVVVVGMLRNLINICNFETAFYWGTPCSDNLHRLV